MFSKSKYLMKDLGRDDDLRNFCPAGLWDKEHLGIAGFGKKEEESICEKKFIERERIKTAGSCSTVSCTGLSRFWIKFLI